MRGDGFGTQGECYEIRKNALAIVCRPNNTFTTSSTAFLDESNRRLRLIRIVAPARHLRVQRASQRISLEILECYR
jgi:hypothetical protein